MPKLIFFDIDGTLWDERMVIPESTISTLKRLQENGHKIFLCSGRARGNIRAKELLDIGFDGIIAACGNHIELDGEVIYENILSPELTEHVVNVLRKCHMPVVLEGPDYHWIDKEGFQEDLQKFWRSIRKRFELISSLGMSCRVRIIRKFADNSGTLLIC